MKLLLLKHYAIQIKLKSKMIRILIYLSLELKDEPLVFKKSVNNGVGHSDGNGNY